MKRERYSSMDLLKGLIMVLMALDHANYFIAKSHIFEFWAVSLPPYTGEAAFLTRFVTHFCAPGFFFLMGVGMVLFSVSRSELGWTQGRIVRFFLLRGGVLILLQMFLENTAWILGAVSDRSQALNRIPVPGGGEQVYVHLGVLFALGGVMIVLSIFLNTRTWLLVLISGGAVAFSQLLLPSAEQGGQLFHPLLRMLLIPGRTGGFQVFYPLLPWLGIAGLGVVFGRLLTKEPRRSFQWGLYSGGILLALFLILRFSGPFGSSHPYQGGGWIEFLNLTKYPPSLTFLLLTLGINLIFLSMFVKWPWIKRIETHPLMVFGRTPLFFYILHLFLFAGMGFLFPTGASLEVVFACWGTVLIILYPLCVSYGKLKRKTPPGSILRLF